MSFNMKGFTAIELMVILFVIAIIASIAIPSYSSYLDRAKRDETSGALTDAKTAMLRFRMDNGSFDISSSGGFSALEEYGFSISGGKYGQNIQITGDQINSDRNFKISAKHLDINCHLEISFGSDVPTPGTDGCPGY